MSSQHRTVKLAWGTVSIMPIDEVRRRLKQDFGVKPKQMEGKSDLDLKDMLCVLSDKRTGHYRKPEKPRVHIGTKEEFLKAGQVAHGTRCHLKFVECGQEVVDRQARFYRPFHHGINGEVLGLVFSVNGSFEKQVYWSDIKECWIQLDQPRPGYR